MLGNFITKIRLFFKLYSIKELSQKQRIICGIQNYFEDTNQNISNLGITKINFTFINNVCNVYITLQKPGLLIGKSGNTIKSLTNYLNNQNYECKIHIIESKLFHTSFENIINL